MYTFSEYWKQILSANPKFTATETTRFKMSIREFKRHLELAYQKGKNDQIINHYKPSDILFPNKLEFPKFPEFLNLDGIFEQAMTTAGKVSSIKKFEKRSRWLWWPFGKK